MRNDTRFNNAQPDNLYQCHHVFPEGKRCGSPRMKDTQFCYHHHDARRPISFHLEREGRRSNFSLFTPNSHCAIQESLGEIIVRLAANSIDSRRAGLLLYALQIASMNLRTTQHSGQPLPEPEPWDDLENIPVDHSRNAGTIKSQESLCNSKPTTAAQRAKDKSPDSAQSPTPGSRTNKPCSHTDPQEGRTEYTLRPETPRHPSSS